MKKAAVMILVLVAAVVITIVMWPKDAVVETEPDDTGMTRDQTEQHMREIGYVQ